MKSSSNIIFLSFVLLGVIITLSANSWFMAWFGLEMNMIGLMPLMISKLNLFSMEAAMKYFIIQSVSSSLLIVASINSLLEFNTIYLTQLALMMKVGAAPTHFWVPSVIEAISWFNMILILTWQKIGPIFLMIFTSKVLLVFFIIPSALIGSISGFNQTSTKKILAFSSISHLAWILTAIKFNITIAFAYFSVYSFTSIAIIKLIEINNTNNLNKIIFMNKSNKINLYIMLISLGGLPPLIGFFPKVLVILANKSISILPLILVASSIINLYFYLRLTFSFLPIFVINQQSKLIMVNPSLALIIFGGPLITLVY